MAMGKIGVFIMPEEDKKHIRELMESYGLKNDTVVISQTFKNTYRTRMKMVCAIKGVPYVEPRFRISSMVIDGITYNTCQPLNDQAMYLRFGGQFT